MNPDPFFLSLTLPHPDVSEGFGAYVHIPFCRARCGYCDFNTYTNLSMGKGGSADSIAGAIIKEILRSKNLLSSKGVSRPLLNSIFFGGGTPSILPASDLSAIICALVDTWGLKKGAEVSVEANPESMNLEKIRALKEAGVNRLSFGMQSADPYVLHVLERRHTPGQVQKVVSEALSLGYECSLDLIYGTPGESIESWKRSLMEAVSLEPQHISAYALTLEPHVPMSRRIARGELQAPNPDDQADKYEIAETILSAAGYRWYEISNWARSGHECHHNITYWKEGNWWGYGPGAHSHVNGTRWWNLRHPVAYAQALAQSHSLPVDGYEILTPEQIREEKIMMGIRLREGISMSAAGVDEKIASDLVDQGLLDSVAFNGAGVKTSSSVPDPSVSADGEKCCNTASDIAEPTERRLVLTMRGRLLADTVIRALW